jgi:uncharacterized membrane protein HdeD (DUF308 family)
MVRLVMILLGVDYLRTRWLSLRIVGCISVLLGVFVFVDALDSALYFPITPFVSLFLLEGLATLAVAWIGMGGQRTLRYVKGIAFTTAAALILIGHEHGNFILSMIFGTLFLADGLLQIVPAKVVRFRTWRLAMIGGAVEIALAIFFYQPFPTHYVGMVPYCVGLGLIFGGWNMILLSARHTPNPTTVVIGRTLCVDVVGRLAVLAPHARIDRGGLMQWRCSRHSPSANARFLRTNAAPIDTAAPIPPMVSDRITTSGPVCVRAENRLTSRPASGCVMLLRRITTPVVLP